MTPNKIGSGWMFYYGPMGVSYRVHHRDKLVEIDSGRNGWIKSAVQYWQFAADRDAFREAAMFGRANYVEDCNAAFKPGPNYIPPTEIGQ